MKRICLVVAAFLLFTGCAASVTDPGFLEPGSVSSSLPEESQNSAAPLDLGQEEEAESQPVPEEAPEESDDIEDDDFEQIKNAIVAPDMLRIDEPYAVTFDGRYRICGLTPEHAYYGNPVYLFDTITEEVSLIDVFLTPLNRYCFDRNDLLISVRYQEIQVANIKTLELIDNFIDFDMKDGARALLGICYDQQEDVYILAWREAVDMTDSDNYFLISLSGFDQYGTHLWDLTTDIEILGGFKSFYTRVDMVPLGERTVSIRATHDDEITVVSY